MPETSNSEPISTRLQRIATLAKQMPDAALNPLAHHIDEAWLLEAYRRTRKDGAVGVDKRTAKDFERDLSGNLRSLLDRAKSGTYWAPPVRRTHIPKGDGKETRPLGIPTFEDKVLQRAVALVLHAVYEPDFHEGSFGFRPGRNAHQALETVQNTLVPFQRPPKGYRGKARAGTFDLLGFTHFWARSRRGIWVVKRKTAKDRLSRALRGINRWCQKNRHRPLMEQWRTLNRKLKGHYAYFGITGNLQCLEAFRTAVMIRWRYWLARRSQKGRMPWRRFFQLLKVFPLAEPRIQYKSWVVA